ncbi:hypothetical protein NN3_05110 [Nocardia neocaledoniensis NBRC 108232]|nr:hypothetical protein NN3_05110 [Nocardia neocaledoniensis NBRC 108232]
MIRDAHSPIVAEPWVRGATWSDDVAQGTGGCRDHRTPDFVRARVARRRGAVGSVALVAPREPPAQWARRLPGGRFPPYNFRM